MSTSTLLRCATARTTPPGSRPFPGRGRAAWSVATDLILVFVASILPLNAATAQERPNPGSSLDLAPAEVRADVPPPPREPSLRIGGAPPAPCVQVDIAGHRAGHLDCASQALQEAARIAQAQARSAIDTPVPAAGSPDVRVGVASLSGTRLRMGNALGTSVHPQRPYRPAPTPRGGRP